VVDPEIGDERSEELAGLVPISRLVGNVDVPLGIYNRWWPGDFFEKPHCFYTVFMAVMVEMHHAGCVPVVRSETTAIIDHALADRPGDWRVLIIGSQANDQ
jgi:hypothetical protein